MKNYGIKILSEKINELVKARDLIIANNFPNLPMDEIQKIDYEIVKLGKCIKVIQISKIYVSNYNDDKNLKEYIDKGGDAKKIAAKKNVVPSTIYSRIREFNKVTKKYK